MELTVFFVFFLFIISSMNLLLAIVINILSYGAIPNDTTVNNAKAINTAIIRCAEKGGGVVEVPAGTFTTGTVFLRSGVTLRLDKAAVLLGTNNLSDYSSLVTDIDLSRYESGQGTDNYNNATDVQWSKAMIFGVGCVDAGIEGEGCIDGGDVRNPLGEEHMRGPHTILLVDCKKMVMRDFTVRRSGNYAFLAYCLDKSSFRNLTVKGGWDGIHIRGGHDLMIKGCKLHTGDDAIAGGYWEKMKITHCILNSSCNGIRMIMPSVDLEVADCDIFGPGQFEHITSHRTRSEHAINLEPGAWGKVAGDMDRICIRRNNIRATLSPLCVTLSDDNTCGTIIVEDMMARDITRMALSVKSWGQAPTDKVVVKNCDFEFDGIDDPSLPAWFDGKPTSKWPVFPCWGMFFRNIRRVDAHNVKLRVKGSEYRKAFMCQNVDKQNIATGVCVEESK